ncbi:MAG: universal stress protein [Nitrospirae bacterium]|nr:universal stress protein [Nitrospirota bacterium]
MKVERILFPTDFSEGAQQALTYAVDLATHYEAKLYMVHVIYDLAKATGMHVPHVSHDEMYKELNKWAATEMDRCCHEELRGFQNIEKAVLKGIPYEEILKFAGDKKIDMIVIGTYGRSGLERFIFGSTAERVVRRAPCAVMTVRVPEHRKS